MADIRIPKLSNADIVYKKDGTRKVIDGSSKDMAVDPGDIIFDANTHTTMVVNADGASALVIGDRGPGKATADTSDDLNMLDTRSRDRFFERLFGWANKGQQEAILANITSTSSSPSEADGGLFPKTTRDAARSYLIGGPSTSGQGWTIGGNDAGSFAGDGSGDAPGVTAPTGPPIGRLEGGDITQNVYDILMRQPTKTRIVKTADGIQITHPKGSHLGKDGLKPQIPVTPAKDATLQYDVTFAPGFDFNKGGKMPGLGGGTANRGGTTPDGHGFSARFMFRSGGHLVAYVYDMNKQGQFGNNIDTGVVFKPGEKYTIRQHIKLNSGSNSDGVLQVWVNGKLCIDQHDMHFVNGDDPKNNIDVLMFHSYYGGGPADQAARNESTTTFNNIQYQPA